jgi:hypothetical protein
MPEKSRPTINRDNFPNLGQNMPELSLGEVEYHRCSLFQDSCKNGPIILVNGVPCWMRDINLMSSCDACVTASKPVFIDLKFKP